MVMWQVVLGVLGCPNLPQEPISDEDAGAEAAGHAADSDVGVIFAARRGGGCAVGPLKSGAALDPDPGPYPGPDCELTVTLSSALIPPPDSDSDPDPDPELYAGRNVVVHCSRDEQCVPTALLQSAAVLLDCVQRNYASGRTPMDCSFQPASPATQQERVCTYPAQGARLHAIVSDP
jgi:hypothetical protein